MVDAPEPVEHAARASSSALSKKIGPLPAGVWAAVIVGGLGIAYWINSRSGVTDVADAAGSYEDTPPEADANNDTQPGAGNLYQPGLYPGTPLFPATPKSNNAWRVAAVQALAGAGRNPLSASIACTRFLKGRRLSERQRQLVAEAIQLVGPPPQGVKLPPNSPQHKPGDGPGHRPHRPTTNAEWVQLAVNKLADKGRDRQFSRTALERWLAGDKITPHQHDIVAQAQRLAGKPPHPPQHHAGVSSHQQQRAGELPGHTAGRRDDGRVPARAASFSEVS